MLDVKNIFVAYENKQIIQDLSFSLELGEIGCLIGPSGEGKTTILRSIAGLNQVKNGFIYIDNQLASSSRVHKKPQERKIGMLFQDYALFPYLNIEQNIAFGIKKNKNYMLRVLDLLDMIQMQHLRYKYPHELSGGQQQRVALARALAPKPKILLLDEPFSSLDTTLREDLAKEVRKLLKQESITAILVTHDQREALGMCDKIGVLYQQNLQQWDTPYNLYHQPKNTWIANFIGKSVLLDAYAHPNYLEIPALNTNNDAVFKVSHITNMRGQVKLLLRADDVVHDDNSPYQAIIIDKIFYGANFLYTLQLKSGQIIYSYVPSHHNHQISESIGLYLDMNHVILYS
jgi:iron(III) transport system ATP-binding protein